MTEKPLTRCPNCDRNSLLWARRVVDSYADWRSLLNVAVRLTEIPEHELVRMTVEERKRHEKNGSNGQGQEGKTK